MSNRYYNFLSNRLVQWLNGRKDLKAGDKYFVLLDNFDEATNFYDSLEVVDFSNKLTFHSDEFGYRTIGLKKENINILFVAPIKEITQDFLVTVRNRVNANQGEWANTAVFFVVFDALDSIIGGAFDVSQKDAPFYTRTIRNEVKGEILAQKALSMGKRKALELYLDDITDNSSTVLKDYETVFSILEKGEIEKEDFNAMGYFPDESLDSIPENVIEDRLLDNQHMFAKVEGLHNYLDIEDKLSDEFSGDGLINKLSKAEQWKEVEYREVEKGVQERNKDKNVILNFDTAKFSDNEEYNWVRIEGEKGAKSKRIHLLMSSMLDSTTNEFSFEVYFDDNVSKSSVVDANTFVFEGHGVPVKDFAVTAKGKKLIFTIYNFNALATYGGLLRFRHKGINKLTFNTWFMIVPFLLTDVQKVRPNFKIEVQKSAKKFFYGISPEVKNYEFGSDVENVIAALSLDDLKGKDLLNSKVVLKESVFDQEENGALRVTAKIKEYFFPISFLDLTEKPRPALPLSIERQRLGNRNSQFIFEDNKIVAGSNVISIEKMYKDRLLIEAQIVEEHSLYGKVIGERYFHKEMALPAGVITAYKELFKFYKIERTLPSLAIANNQHTFLLTNVIREIRHAMQEGLVEGEKTPKEIANLSLVGTVIEGEGISLTPLHPLMISYQLELTKQLNIEGDIPKENILSTLNPQYLLPYMKFEDEEYQLAYTRSVPRWLFYNKMQERQLSDLASNVITHRLDDYITQYKFLFETNHEMALNIAAIRIVDEVNFFDAIVNFIFNRLKEVESLDSINPVNIYFDKLGIKIDSLFRELYEIRSLDKLNDILRNPYKGSSFEDYEVLELLQKKINIFKMPEAKNFEAMGLFFHVTFYQFVQRRGISNAKMEKLGKNYALGGLLSSPQYYKEVNSYSNGFGVGRIMERNRTELVDFIFEWNSFIASSNKDTDIYRYGDTLINNIPQLNQDEITPVLKNSSWVTLLNLDVDLSYFFDESNGEMLVIHYTDQSATSQYESVTVTDDTQQYDRLLRETLLEELSDRDQFDTKEVIKNFNVINGQWLLMLISDKEKKRGNSNLLREKLSIISAYKEMLGILEHPNFYWIPISLEEILRVSGMVGLSMKEGLFSSKNLGQTGATSDDLLFVGIDLRGDDIKLHYLPIEVKVGNNSNSVTEKAFSQLEHTSNILREFLGDENPDVFMRNYYRNFFVSIILGNLEKMMSSGIFTKSEIPNYQNIKDRLIVGDYYISYEMEQFYGQGVVFEFSKNEIARQASLVSNRNALLIKVPEKDAYNVVADRTTVIVDSIQKGMFDFRKDMLLSSKVDISDVIKDFDSPKEEIELSLNPEILDDNSEYVDIDLDVPFEIPVNNFTEEQEKDTEDTVKYDGEEITDSTINADRDEIIDETIKVEKELAEEYVAIEKEDFKHIPTQTEGMAESIRHKRVLLGEIAHSSREVYWEFGNKKLANRHLFITGKSGQGKTYFVQTLLAELSRLSIDSLVIDYTDGFLQNQLDKQFLTDYENKVSQRFILRDKVPINPFKLQEIDLGGFVMPESNQDMVDRVVQVIDFVFDLGVQQRTLLSETILQGVHVNGEAYRFANLADELRYSEDKALQNLYGRISALLSRDPFSYESDFDWGQVFGNQGIINIFQLKGYQLNIQKVLIEFLLWDLYQYATRTGSEAKPLPVVLDEVQNLNFSGSSPAVKMLREGRKFGISGIFATQSLDSIKGNDAEAIYNAAEQLHFLPPDSQVSAIAKSITSNPNDRKDVENSLKTLLKGETIVYGPIQLDNGNLSEPRINIVKISSFESRRARLQKLT
ncbi:DNA phosphorothioation-dependent restriction protein DptH [Enterococcus sp. AZ194]|uniref:ATP-binding protein n=1 Tax=Enterococcus sp. AZ194 TaxID=2774629 RepID=UPI003F26B4C9